ncbi:MAG: helix-turn-helix domain-containing protein [Pricia sp.]|nr:helix-turn-helix domain-containing protein [Pricia sp.]
MDKQFLQRLISILDTHLSDEQFGVKELAREAGLSKSQILRKIKAFKNKSTSQFIREYRLKKAMELLQQNAATVSEIAYRVGFSSPTYFSTCFHDHFGYPPVEAKHQSIMPTPSVFVDEVADRLPEKFTTTHSNKRLVLHFSLVILLFLSASFVLFFRTNNDKSGMEFTSPLTAIEGENKIEKSIGVMPFMNLSGNREFDYVSEGMTGAIIDKLTRLESIKRVVSFTTMSTFKETDKGIKEIASELGVTHLLEGNLQKAGDTVKIVLRLIDGIKETYDWSEEYISTWEVNELFQMQAQITETVATKMGVELNSQEIKTIERKHTDNILAYTYYQQAEFQKNKYNKVGFDLAEELYMKAIQQDPSFADPYVGLGCIWQLRGWWGLHKEKEALANSLHYLEKAIDRDPKNKWAVGFYYIMSFWYNWDFEKVEPFFQRMQKEGSLHKVWTLVDYAMKTNREFTALQFFEKEILDVPNNPKYHATMIQLLWVNGMYAECDSILKEESKLFEDNRLYNMHAAKFYIGMRDYEQASKYIEKLEFTEESSTFDKVAYCWLNAFLQSVSGSQKKADEYISQLITYYYEMVPGSPGWFVALYYSAIGDHEKTLEWIQKSYDHHEVEMSWLHAEPLLEPVRNDPRYKELWHKVGFSKVIPFVATTIK